MRRTSCESFRAQPRNGRAFALRRAPRPSSPIPTPHCAERAARGRRCWGPAQSWRSSSASSSSSRARSFLRAARRGRSRWSPRSGCRTWTSASRASASRCARTPMPASAPSARCAAARPPRAHLYRPLARGGCPQAGWGVVLSRGRGEAEARGRGAAARGEGDAGAAALPQLAHSVRPRALLAPPPAPPAPRRVARDARGGGGAGGCLRSRRRWSCGRSGERRYSTPTWCRLGRTAPSCGRSSACPSSAGEGRACRGMNAATVRAAWRG